MERGTYFPLPVSVNTVSSSPEAWRALALGSGRPSCNRPCSRRYLVVRYQQMGQYRVAVGVITASIMVRTRGDNLQLPRAVTKLGTSLADMEMENLMTQRSISINISWRRSFSMSLKLPIPCLVSAVHKFTPTRPRGTGASCIPALSSWRERALSTYLATSHFDG